jgi:hypothetical protein
LGTYSLTRYFLTRIKDRQPHNSQQDSHPLEEHSHLQEEDSHRIGMRTSQQTLGEVEEEEMVEDQEEDQEVDQEVEEGMGQQFQAEGSKSQPMVEGLES